MKEWKRPVSLYAGFFVIVWTLVMIPLPVSIAGSNFLAWASGSDSVRSTPPDTKPYVRELVPEEIAAKGPGRILAPVTPGAFVRDVVVSNTDPNLTNTDTAGDEETSIAINPENPDEIVISSFSGSWKGGNNAPIYHSTDGGVTWTRELSVPPPAGWPLACPCDWTFDFGRGGQLSATILGLSPTTTPIPCGGQGMPDCTVDVVTGTTTNPASAASWNYFLLTAPPGPNIPRAKETNSNVPSSLGNADQPWMLVNPDPTTPAQDNVYVAWDDFNNSDGIDGPDMRVAVSYGLNPPNFTIDRQVGNALGSINPGFRLAKDPRTGYMWALWQRNPGAGLGGSKNIDYMLNRTVDGGQTWSLNGSSTGIVVANADSTQPDKFGTVNALLGGVDHAAVDPNTGDLYYVYGNRDAVTDNNRLAIRRVSGNGAGGVTIGPESFVSGQVQAAIPSVAVNSSGTVAVFYYTFNGFSSDGFPIFSAHLALSSDQGVTFSDRVLLTFLSSAKNDPTDGSQRVLGDYQQIKTVGNTFYGSFTGNGAPFGRPVSNHDPIFYKVSIGPEIRVQSQVDVGSACVGKTSLSALDVCNTGNDDLLVSSFNSSNTQFAVTESSGFPVILSPNLCFPFQLRFTPTSTGSKSATLTIASNDAANPSVTVQAAGNGSQQVIQVTGSTSFGEVCAGTQAEKTISVCNVGACALSITSASFNPACSDFTLINNPFPGSVGPGSCTSLTIRFTPTSAGPKTCNLVITSDDPNNPIITLPVTADTPTGSLIDAASLYFFPEVIKTRTSCQSQITLPISNPGNCAAKITNVAIGGSDAANYSLSGVPVLPFNLAPGETLGDGNLGVIFKPALINRDLNAQVNVTYESDPITHATATVTGAICGEGVTTGARILVTHNGIPVPTVYKVRLSRILRIGSFTVGVRKVDEKYNLNLITVNPSAPCQPFQYHREYGTVSNVARLEPGTYRVTAVGKAGNTYVSATKDFDLGSTCDFNPNIVVELP